VGLEERACADRIAASREEGEGGSHLLHQHPKRTHRRRTPVPLWGPYIADLVTTLQRSFPNITLPAPDLAYFIAILLYVDDFAFLASSRAQLLALMQQSNANLV
jgi:hypothetical protein